MDLIEKCVTIPSIDCIHSTPIVSFRSTPIVMYLIPTGQVERMVEQAYEQYLFDECSKQTNYKSGLEKQARKEKDPEKQKLQARRAAEFELTRCVELDDLFPGRRSGRNKNQRYRAY